MFRLLPVFLFFVFVPALPGISAESTPLTGLTTRQLEARVESIDSELDRLARLSMRSGVGAIGYRSIPYQDPHQQEWVQIDLGDAVPVDQITLVPSIWRDRNAGFRADAFPASFRILGGKGKEAEPITLVSVEESDGHLPRVAPLVLNCPTTTVSWIRLETSKLSAHEWDGRYYLQLAEMLVFSGNKNVALRRPVTTSSDGWGSVGARREQFLVDGGTPYLMHSARGEKSIAYFSDNDVEARHVFLWDLTKVREVDAVHLHSIDISDTVPQSNPSDYAIPRRLWIEGALREDFSDATLLLDYHHRSPFDANPILMFTLPPTPCRFLRLTVKEPYLYREADEVSARIGFAEITFFSSGHAITLGNPPSCNIPNPHPDRALSALGDGHNIFGEILPVRTWLSELARRHDLEQARPLVVRELNGRYLAQQVNLRKMSWVIAILLAGAVISTLVNRMLQMRKIANIRERLAADLHDELGANLHTIGLLSDLAEGVRDDPEQLSMLHGKIRKVTERTGTAVRHCTDMLRAEELYTGLLSDMERAAKRILAGLPHDLQIEGEGYLSNLPPRVRVDLFLFYKESLVNISRHSSATAFRTQLNASANCVELSIEDNGHGKLDQVPASLKRRAGFLRGQVSLEHPPGGGTCIRLTVRIRNRKAC